MTQIKVSYEYDQDPRYGWVSVETNGRKEILVIIYAEGVARGFSFNGEIMEPTCICSARESYECGCPNVRWEK